MLLRGPLCNVVSRVLQEGLLALDMLHTVLLEAEVVAVGLNPHLLTLDAPALAIRLGYSREPGYSRQNVLLVRFRSLWRTPILCLEVYLLDGSLRFDRGRYLNFLVIGAHLEVGRMLRKSLISDLPTAVERPPRDMIALLQDIGSFRAHINRVLRELLLISLLHESDAHGVWRAALVEFYVLNDLLVCCLEHVLGESVMAPVRIIRVWHALDLAQLAHRLGVRVPSDCHRRRVLRHFSVLLDRLIVRDIVKGSHVELPVIIHKLICHPVYRLNQIQGLVFGQRVSLQSVLVVLT